MTPAPEKPKFGSPCNGCGLCCAIVVCKIGQIAFGDIAGPCPAMTFIEDRFYCGLVLAEKAFIENSPELMIKPLISNALAIGKGCDSED
jgi:hypothetical protein